MIQIYKASAGSGKTFTLAREFIKMMLGRQGSDGNYRLNTRSRNRHRPILAITFTNKATGEMKRRIIDELALLGGTHPTRPEEASPYIDDLCRELHCSPDELKAEAQRALSELLFDYDYFCVSTIDSFFQQVLRTFAREAELTGNYELSLDDRLAVYQAVDDLFQSLGPESRRPVERLHALRLEDWLLSFLTDRMAEGSNLKLFNRGSSTFNELVGFVTELQDETYKMHEQELREYFDHPDRIPALMQALRELSARRLRNRCELCSAAADLLNTIPGIAANPKNLITNLSRPDAPFNAKSKTLENLIADPKTVFKKSDKAYRANLERTDVIGVVSAAIEAISEWDKTYRLFRLLRENLYRLGLFGDIISNLEANRRETNTLLLSDTSTLLNNILKDPSDTPFVFERMGNRLSHFLIDEFQDTSRMQWLNLRPLLTETVSRGCESLIIGDEKQCIYRFRNSDPTLLKSGVAQDFPDSVNVKGDAPGDNTNWRSLAQVVRFNNTLFGLLADHLGFGDIYSNVSQNVAPTNLKPGIPEGYVDLMINSGGEPDLSMLPSDTQDRIETAIAQNGWNTDTYRVAALERMATEIRRQLTEGRRAGEIAVLVRTNKEGDMVITSLLERQANDPDFPKFRMVSDESMYLRSAPSVRLLVSLLRRVAGLVAPPARDDNDNDNDKPESRSQRNERIIRLSGLFHAHTAAGINPDDALSMAVTELQELSADDDPDIDLLQSAVQMECPNLLSLVEQLAAIYLSQETCRNESLYISTFQDVVADYCSRNNDDGNDVAGFLKWWDAKSNKLSVTLPADEDAMRIMTIHKSKGLEFACVHLPFCAVPLSNSETNSKYKSIHWFDTAPIAAALPEDASRLLPPLYPLVLSHSLVDTPVREEYLKVVREEQLDTLNLLYVAMTRAVEELSVTMFSASETDNDVKTAILGLIDQIPQLSVEQSSNTIRATAGTPLTSDLLKQLRVKRHRNQPADDEQTAACIMPAYHSDGNNNVWADVRVELPDASLNILSDDYLTGDEEEDSAARRRGIVLHTVLSMIFTVDDLPKAIGRLVRRRSIAADEAEGVQQMLEAALADSRVAAWFAPDARVLNERGIRIPASARQEGSLKRPDRVTILPDGSVHVIDYKFGNPSARSMAIYRRQLQGYMNLLRNLSHKDVRGHLWMVDRGEIIDL